MALGSSRLSGPSPSILVATTIPAGGSGNFTLEESGDTVVAYHDWLHNDVDLIAGDKVIIQWFMDGQRFRIIELRTGVDYVAWIPGTLPKASGTAPTRKVGVGIGNIYYRHRTTDILTLLKSNVTIYNFCSSPMTGMVFVTMDGTGDWYVTAECCDDS